MASKQAKNVLSTYCRAKSFGRESLPSDLSSRLGGYHLQSTGRPWLPGRNISRLSWNANNESKSQSFGDSGKAASVEELSQVLMSRKFDYVRFEQSDMHGLSKCKLIPINHFKSKMTSGINFSLSHMIRDPNGFKVRDTGLWYERGMGDAVGTPDFESFRILPWCESGARIIVEPTVDGEPLEAHPRCIARRQIERLDSIGLSVLAAHEYEFVVLKGKSREPLFDNNNCGYLLNITRDEPLIQQFMQFLPQMGLNVESIESEAGPGQLEITYRPTTGLSACDNGYTLKTSVKEICEKNGYKASFMSKQSDICTSSSHFCHSLWDKDNQVSLMHDGDHPLGLSSIAQHWIAGLIHHAPAMTLLMCPTINCLNRLGTSESTPTTASWGMDNRSCAFRVNSPGNNPSSMFIENRIGGAGSNPYLTMAATIAAGLDGIQRGIPLPNPTEGVVTSSTGHPVRNLPTNMVDCIEAFLADDVICDAVGKDFVRCFSALKHHEMKLEKEAADSGDDRWHFNFFEHV